MTADTARRRLGLLPEGGEEWDDPIITSEYRYRGLRKEDRQRRLKMHKSGKVPPIPIWRVR